MVVVRRHVQRRDPVLALGVDGGRVPRQQQTGHLQVAVLRRQVERRETLLGRRRLGGVVVQQDRGNLSKESARKSVQLPPFT